MNKNQNNKLKSEIVEHTKGYDGMYRARNAINRKESIGKLGYTLYEYGFIYKRKMKKIQKVLDEITQINKKLNVLEIGCGTGDLIPYLYTYSGLYHGTDISGFQIECARENSLPYKNVYFSVNSAESLPLKSNLFDVVIAADVIEHLHNPEKAMLEVARVTKKGGWIIMTTPYAVEKKENYAVDYKEYNVEGKSFILKEYYFEPSQLIKMTEEAGYQVLERIRYGRFLIILTSYMKNIPALIQRVAGCTFALIDDTIEFLFGRFIKRGSGYQMFVAKKNRDSNNNTAKIQRTR